MTDHYGYCDCLECLGGVPLSALRPPSRTEPTPRRKRDERLNREYICLGCHGSGRVTRRRAKRLTRLAWRAAL